MKKQAGRAVSRAGRGSIGRLLMYGAATLAIFVSLVVTEVPAFADNPPLLTIAFTSGPTLPVNGVATIGFDLYNNNGGVLNSISFTDTLPTGLVVAGNNPISGSCGGGVITANPSSSVISLFGATLQGETECAFSVNVTTPLQGSYTDAVSSISTLQTGTVPVSASATVSSLSAPTVEVLFHDLTTPPPTPTIPLNSTTTLQLLIANPNAVNSLSGLAFTDTLPAGLGDASVDADYCGGALTVNAAGTTITLVGGVIAANSLCSAVLTVTGIVAGLQTDSVSGVSSNEGGTGVGASASVIVVAPPTVSGAYGASPIPFDGTTSFTLTIGNPNTLTPLTGVAFTDTLPSGLVIAGTPTTTCPSGTASSSGPTNLALSGATLAVGASCTVTVEVEGTSPGLQDIDTAVSSNEGGTSVTNVAGLTVELDPPQITTGSGFTNSPILEGQSDVLTLIVTNPNSGAGQALTGVAFTDTLPTGLVAGSAADSATCGTVSVTGPGATSFGFSDATLAPSASCTLTINVTAQGPPGTEVVATTPTATNTSGTDVTTTYSLTVNELVLGPSSLPGGNNGVGYSQTISVNAGASTPNGSGPFTFTTPAASLPPGLSLSSGGVLSGTPTTAGTYTFLVTATQSDGGFGTLSYTVVIGPALAPPAPSTLAMQGCALYTLGFTTGVAGSTYAVTSGVLPTGLSLNRTTGVLSGYPTTFGTYPFTVTGTPPVGSGYSPVSHNYVYSVSLCIGPVSGVLPAGTHLKAYSYQLSTTGGTAPYRYLITSGGLPNGLSLSTTGLISGIPASPGVFTVTIEAGDSSQTVKSSLHTFTLTIS